LPEKKGPAPAGSLKCGCSLLIPYLNSGVCAPINQIWFLPDFYADKTAERIHDLAPYYLLRHKKILNNDTDEFDDTDELELN